MKKVFYNLLVVAVVMTMTALTSCDDNPFGERELVGCDNTYHIIYADRTINDGYGISTTSAVYDFWEASIFEPEKTPWITSVTVEPKHSNHLTSHFTFFVHVELNTSGIDRTGVILVKTRAYGRNEVLVQKVNVIQVATAHDVPLFTNPN